MREHDFDPDERSGQVAATVLRFLAGGLGAVGVALLAAAGLLVWAIERGGPS